MLSGKRHFVDACGVWVFSGMWHEEGEIHTGAIYLFLGIKWEKGTMSKTCSVFPKLFLT